MCRRSQPPPGPPGPVIDAPRQVGVPGFPSPPADTFPAVPEDQQPVEPPERVVYDLDEAVTLLAVLEDARDALISSGHLAGVLATEAEIRLLSHRLGFDAPPGGRDG